MSDLRKLLADAGAWIASSEAPGSAEVAAEIEAALAATTDEPGLRAQRLGPCSECGQMTVVIHEKPWDKPSPHHARLSESPSDGGTE